MACPASIGECAREPRVATEPMRLGTVGHAVAQALTDGVPLDAAMLASLAAAPTNDFRHPDTTGRL